MIVLKVWVEEGEPDSLKLMVEAAVEGRETDTVQADQLVLVNGVVIIDFEEDFEGFELVEVQGDTREGEGLVPNGCIRLEFFLGYLGGLVRTGDLNIGV